MQNSELNLDKAELKINYTKLKNLTIVKKLSSNYFYHKQFKLIDLIELINFVVYDLQIHDIVKAGAD